MGWRRKMLEDGHWIPVAVVLFLAMILVGVLWANGVFGGSSSRSSDTREAAQSRAQGFLELISDRRYNEAADLVRLPGEQVSASAIAERLRGEQALRGLSAGRLGHYSRRNGTAIVSGSLQSNSGEVGVEVHLSRRGEEWWIAEMVLAGRPVISGS